MNGGTYDKFLEPKPDSLEKILHEWTTKQIVRKILGLYFSSVWVIRTVAIPKIECQA